MIALSVVASPVIDGSPLEGPFVGGASEAMGLIRTMRRDPTRPWFEEPSQGELVAQVEVYTDGVPRVHVWDSHGQAWYPFESELLLRCQRDIPRRAAVPHLARAYALITSHQRARVGAEGG